MKNKIVYQTSKQKIIYVFRINDKAHKGMLKIGDTSNELVDFDFNEENTIEMEKQAKRRIDEYTRTAGIEYDLLYTAIAINNNGEAFRDYDVHRVLISSGIKKEKIVGANEWFKVDLNTAINAIKAVKNARSVLTGAEITKDLSPIIFREEQREAIKRTILRFKGKDTKEMLWNAKMRFGKTLSALEVIRQMKYEKSIIITHRPVVDDGWFSDYKKIFATYNNYQYGSKGKGVNIDNLIEDKEKKNINYIYFASMQDLRGSKGVGGKFDKNETLYNVDWDLVIIDEAHEGTTTKLGENVIAELKKSKTKFLYLSGTPFNIQEKFEDENVYTWDYTMEQYAKEEWSKRYPLESNPYDDLPRINIFTYNLDEDIKNYFDMSDKAFNFKEFFRVYTGDVGIDRCEMPNDVEIGDFIHKTDVNKFLDLMTKTDNETNYPFSTEYYRDNFKHTLWIIPGVREAKALSKLLKNHKVFGKFTIVNVAGEGDEDEQKDEALDKVKKAIKENDYTITLSCGKLTTGTTIKEWTAVMYLAGSYFTSAASYLQTIFRVQTPCKANGKVKENCYVFDFAPDRILRILAEACSMSIKQTNDNKKRIILNMLINYLPVISMKGSSTKKYDVDHLLRELKSAYAERVARNGFDDNKLYNDKLLHLDNLDIEKFNELREIIGKQTSDKPKNKITINKQGLNNAELESIEEIQNAVKKKKRELSDEEKEKLLRYIEAKKQKDIAVSILRGISVRIPLLIYGMDKDFDEEINIDNFTDMIDDESFEEFMPKGITKKKFNEFKKYYDKDVFVEAGKLIRLKLKNCDKLPVLERIQEISAIFKTFRNPDKETVLTPWKTVNMHLSDTLGGYYLYKEDNEEGKDFEAKLINNGDVTEDTLLNVNAKILEINSKTGLYQLYVAYSIFRARLDKIDVKNITKDKVDDLWFKTIEDNIYVLCKTKMAKTITLRTLCGYNMYRHRNNYVIKGGYKSNIHYFENYVNQVKNKQDKIIEKISSAKYWGKEGVENMKFDAVVGNPPYQEVLGIYNGTVAQANPVYNKFIEFSIKMSNRYSTLITPSLWMTAGTGLDDFRKNILSRKDILKLVDYETADNIFPNVAIAGGISYLLFDKKYSGKVENKYITRNDDVIIDNVFMDKFGTELFVRDPMAGDILNTVGVFKSNFKSFIDLVSTNSPFSKGVAGVFKDKELKKPSKNSVKIYRFSKDRNDKFGYVARNCIKIKKEWIDCHKVFVSKAGEISAKFNGLPFYGEPNSICSETYMLIGPFKSKKICENVISYMNTYLYKFLIAQIKKTQNAARGVYKYVPMIDFDNMVTNEKLYKMFNLSKKQIQYIEKVVNC